MSGWREDAQCLRKAVNTQMVMSIRSGASTSQPVIIQAEI
jgi:hypothetical protein